MGREGTYVAEHQGQRTLQTAELQIFGVLRQPRHDRRRDKAAEGGANLIHLVSLLVKQRHDACEEHKTGREARGDGIKQHAVAGEREPTRPRHGPGGYGPQQRAPNDRHDGHCDDQGQCEHRACQRFCPGRPVGPKQRYAAKNLLDQLRMRLDARR